MKETDIYTIFGEALKRLSSKAPGYRVRNATRDDLDKVIEVNLTSLPEHYPRQFFEELLESWGKAFYVAESPEGEVVGYIMTRVELKPGFFKHFLVRSGHVVSIAVLEDYRRHGLGYALMAYAMKSMHDDYR
ncbi:MAG: N-acetyltransferase, partial [Desulfurococcaceae archaeon]